MGNAKDTRQLETKIKDSATILKRNLDFISAKELERGDVQKPLGADEGGRTRRRPGKNSIKECGRYHKENQTLLIKWKQ